MMKRRAIGLAIGMVLLTAACGQTDEPADNGTSSPGGATTSVTSPGAGETSTAPTTDPASDPSTTAPTGDPATTAPSSSTGAVPTSAEPTRLAEEVHYLALGDSLAAGYQPDGSGTEPNGDDPTGGYAGPVLKEVRLKHPGVKLTNLGCSGETAVSLMEGGRCDYPEGSQLDAALAYLDTHGDQTVLITLDIGANDLFGCGHGTSFDTACLANVPKDVGTRTSQVIAALREKAPTAQIVALNYYNPFVSVPDAQMGRQSNVAINALNTAIGSAAKQNDAQVADVARAFGTGDGSKPVDAAQRDAVCDLTWMCTAQDIHANDAGYQKMAEAVIAVLN